MIDIRAARHDPDAFRAALARKGADKVFDDFLAVDERWRALETRVTELRTKTNLKGKPTPEQLDELRKVKEELKRLEDEHAGAAAQRDDLLARIPNPPADAAPDGDSDQDAREVRRFREPPREDRCGYRKGKRTRRRGQVTLGPRGRAAACESRERFDCRSGRDS